MKLTGKVALVSGGGGGIGRAISLAFIDAGAAIACCDIDYAVRHFDVRQHLALPAQQSLVFGLGIVGFAVDEALDLVELMHADDAARVLAVAAGLAAEARRPAGVAKWSVGQIEDLVGVESGQRHF